MKMRVFAAAGLLLCLGTAVPEAQAQGKCSLRTFVGTYVFQETGSSLLVNPSQTPVPSHWAGAIAPFVTVGEVTMHPDGVGNGFYWIRNGSINGGLEPIPVTITVTEMNQDCTGKLTYQVNLPGVSPPPVIEERIILSDNGREWHSVPTSIVNGDPTLAWIGTGHRIGKSDEPVTTCGPQTAHGTYLVTAENIIATSPTTAFTDTILLRMNVSMSGEYTGKLYERVATIPVELGISGTFSVNPDCSFSWSLNVDTIPGTIGLRGVFFNEGKGLYGLANDPSNAPIIASAVQGERISQ